MLSTEQNNFNNNIIPYETAPYWKSSCCSICCLVREKMNHLLSKCMMKLKNKQKEFYGLKSLSGINWLWLYRSKSSKVNMEISESEISVWNIRALLVPWNVYFRYVSTEYLHLSLSDIHFFKNCEVSCMWLRGFTSCLAWINAVDAASWAQAVTVCHWPFWEAVWNNILVCSRRSFFQSDKMRWTVVDDRNGEKIL